MTARTSQHLADVLRAAGFDALAVRAEADEFHEFLSDHHGMPLSVLNNALVDLMQTAPVQRQRVAAAMIRERMIDGEFDADDAESEAWAESDAGQAMFRELGRDLKR